MGKQKTLVPWFQRGDIGGMTYSITNNIVNYLIVIATLSGVLEWPDKIVYGYVIPGMSIGLLCSGVYYAYMGRRLSKKRRSCGCYGTSFRSFHTGNVCDAIRRDHAASLCIE